MGGDILEIYCTYQTKTKRHKLFVEHTEGSSIAWVGSTSVRALAQRRVADKRDRNSEHPNNKCCAPVAILVDL